VSCTAPVLPRFAARRVGEPVVSLAPSRHVDACAPGATASVDTNVSSSRGRLDARVRRPAEEAAEELAPDAVAAVPVAVRAGKLLAGTPASAAAATLDTDGALRVRWCGLGAPCTKLSEKRQAVGIGLKYTPLCWLHLDLELTGLHFVVWNVKA